MSWDYNVTTKQCPCGKGLIKETYGSNDWNQTSYHREILCPDCLEKENKDKELKEERKIVANQKINILISYFKEYYKEILMSKFSNVKTKKSIWEIAYEIGLETYSESSFYLHTKGKTLLIEEYIDRKISWNNISKLISYLEIKDTKLENLYKDAALHIKEFEDENYRLAYLRAKGKI